MSTEYSQIKMLLYVFLSLLTFLSEKLIAFYN